jgi:hypothetical protein
VNIRSEKVKGTSQEVMYMTSRTILGSVVCANFILTFVCAYELLFRFFPRMLLSRIIMLLREKVARSLPPLQSP